MRQDPRNPSIDGIKLLVESNPPVAVVADPQIINDAPFEMTTAGLGDILAKSASSSDWKLNNVLFGDYYCGRSLSLIADLEPMYMNNPEDIKELQSDAMQALFQGLILTGVAMTMAGTSAPASAEEIIETVV